MKAIRISNLGKSYRIRHQAAARRKARTVREELTEWVKRMLSAEARRRNREVSRETFWALRDINLEVERGEALGIIGHNGAGKSTLLKLLSRITEPTTGEIELAGRVASLLEVATGFHPELTGRENIFLKGAIMGMPRAETRRRFDEIVEFSGVEQFLDTPVKRYSSGMYVKLGFAVAAHLEPDILIVDEVLAVGDAQFQKKCVEKMQAILSREGRTILFVSHNLGLVRDLCRRAIVLEAGGIVDDGEASTVTNRYLERVTRATRGSLAERKDRRGAGNMRLINVKAFCPAPDGGEGPLVTGQPARFEFEVDKVLPGATCLAMILDDARVWLTNFTSDLYSPNDRSAESAGENKFVCEIDALPLTMGRFSLNITLAAHQEEQDHLTAAHFFDVERGGYLGRYPAKWRGLGPVTLDYRWIKPKGAD